VIVMTLVYRSDPVAAARAHRRHDLEALALAVGTLAVLFALAVAVTIWPAAF
jgi:hypothetical protein